MTLKTFHNGVAGADLASLAVPPASAQALANAIAGSSGAGVTVGIVSDSFDALGGAAADEASGALPAPGDISILQDDPDGTDEGRAMAEVIHAIAPDARIDFYSGDFGPRDFAGGIAALQDAGAGVIVDDLSYPDEPFYRLGTPIDRAIRAFTAGGGTYVTSSGNAGPLSFYENHFQPGQTSLPGVGDVTAMNFGTADAPDYLEPVSLSGGYPTTFDLQWAQPPASAGGSSYSLAFALYGPRGNLVRTVSADAVGGDPVQIGTITPRRSGVFSLAVYTTEGTDLGDLFKIVGDNDGDPSVIFAGSSGSGSLYGHALSPSAITVGADDAGAAEDFNSSGPGQVLFGADGQPLTSPVTLAKPDLDGPDGQATTVPDLSPFFGTSAAAAAVAADAALLLQIDPGLTAGQVRGLLARTATPDGERRQSGAGLVNPQAALGLLLRELGLDTTAMTAEASPHAAATHAPLASAVHPTARDGVPDMHRHPGLWA